ncbi:hypothetical protein [Levilactobacillus tujiorum]|uniref:Uncharacterized protein n=1 Tax=Levilactobacillus tujiorum TaxID=2912243 RepID=A0ABX1L5N5_9LACO|nr:hypothetical protein [Levilactobacillus tujiorum]MCH5464640.1 hypothetical protein [Levilactobacillus tujiorum]NLR11678.1 hypothetical protein [Lactobacillus sp. HBUAS51387]NLR29599.1 hypothetical protein [Levilactobacillus tujiorum]NLR32358.1 hypothetical protein [Levilactobacillus tujiorum]
MQALVIILFIITLAGIGQLYLNNREEFRKNSKHLATRGSKFHDDSNRRLS